MQDIQLDRHLLQDLAQGGILLRLGPGAIQTAELEIFHRQVLYRAVPGCFSVRIPFRTVRIGFLVVYDAEQGLPGFGCSILKRNPAVLFQFPVQQSCQGGGSGIANRIFQVKGNLPQPGLDVF